MACNIFFQAIEIKQRETTQSRQSYVIRLREAVSDRYDFGEATIVDRRIREQVLLNGNNNNFGEGLWRTIEA